MILHQIALKHNADKSYRHHYCDKYEKFIGNMRFDQINVLEIGILRGESLRTWKEYFPNATIHGIDIDPGCLQYHEERITTTLGSQNDEIFLRKIENDLGPFRLIIDDGSHVWGDIIKSFEILFPLLSPGGIYVVEDLHTSYNFDFCGDAKITSISYLKSLIDNVNSFGMYGYKYARAARLKNSLVKEKNLHVHNKIDGIHFYPGICFIEKSNE